MAVSTDKLIPGVLPPRDEQEGIDFLQILDDFDPSTLSSEVLEAFASRDPYVTAYGSEMSYYKAEGVSRVVPDIPAESRLSAGQSDVKWDREQLMERIDKYNAGVPGAYKKCRQALIKAIGAKTCAFIVERELSSLSQEQREQQKKDYDRWKKYVNGQYENRQLEEAQVWYYNKEASFSEKVAAVRKGVKSASGRAFKQRDFAKLIGYPVSKYVAAEKNDDMVGYDLLEKLIMICHANPYYLYDRNCFAEMGEYGGHAVDVGDAPSIIVGLDVIWKWIQEGKPRNTDWIDGVTEKQRSAWD